jgi:hypothetical protein
MDAATNAPVTADTFVSGPLDGSKTIRGHWRR